MPTFLRPGPGVGSIEHFYHFTVEYLVPLFERDVKYGIAGKGHVVRDCGPLNVWLDFVFGPDAFTMASREQLGEKRPWSRWDKKIQLDAFAGQEGISIDAERFTQVLAAFREKFMPRWLTGRQSRSSTVAHPRRVEYDQLGSKLVPNPQY